MKENEITESDCRLAGYGSMSALLDELNRNGQGEIYRIEFHYGGLDDLAELRYIDFFSSEEVDEIKSQLEKLDEAGNQGPWTAEVLHLIKNNEDAVIEELASSVNMSVSIFIENVHQLESLALVEPLSKVGCRLSPRGDALLEHLRPCSTERINRRHLRSAVSGIGF